MRYNIKTVLYYIDWYLLNSKTKECFPTVIYTYMHIFACFYDTGDWRGVPPAEYQLWPGVSWQSQRQRQRWDADLLPGRQGSGRGHRDHLLSGAFRQPGAPDPLLWQDQRADQSGQRVLRRQPECFCQHGQQHADEHRQQQQQPSNMPALPLRARGGWGGRGGRRGDRDSDRGRRSCCGRCSVGRKTTKLNLHKKRKGNPGWRPEEDRAVQVFPINPELLAHPRVCSFRIRTSREMTRWHGQSHSLLGIFNCLPPSEDKHGLKMKETRNPLFSIPDD